MTNTWLPEGRRSSIQIIAEILRLLRLGELGKTEIMCTVNMSFHQTQRYLNWLLELGLLDKMTQKNHLVSYRATEKGLKLLTEIESMQEMFHRKETLDVLHAPEVFKAATQDRPTVESSLIKEA